MQVCLIVSVWTSVFCVSGYTCSCYWLSVPKRLAFMIALIFSKLCCSLKQPSPELYLLCSLIFISQSGFDSICWWHLLEIHWQSGAYFQCPTLHSSWCSLTLWLNSVTESMYISDRKFKLRVLATCGEISLVQYLGKRAASFFKVTRFVSGSWVSKKAYYVTWLKNSKNTCSWGAVFVIGWKQHIVVAGGKKNASLS